MVSKLFPYSTSLENLWHQKCLSNSNPTHKRRSQKMARIFPKLNLNHSMVRPYRELQSKCGPRANCSPLPQTISYTGHQTTVRTLGEISARGASISMLNLPTTQSILLNFTLYFLSLAMFLQSNFQIADTCIKFYS